MALCLGIDTSNYTTSVALFDGVSGYNLGRLLDVPEGALGLRQSDALFQHVKHLPEIFAALRAEGRLDGCIAAVGASTKPRWVEGSYMPCFLAGESQGRGIADTLGVPFFPCAHQQGHIAAAAWSRSFRPSPSGLASVRRDDGAFVCAAGRGERLGAETGGDQ